LHARIGWFGVVAAIMFFCARAEAAVTVLGTAQAVECFEKADAGSSDPKACDDALHDPDLLGRDRAATFVNRGIIYNTARKLDLALADFASALAIDPNIAEAYLNRGNSKFFQGKLNEAIADFTRALELKLDRKSAAYYNRALAYVALGRLKEAKSDLESALDADPDFKEAKDELALVNKALASNGTVPPQSATPR